MVKAKSKYSRRFLTLWVFHPFAQHLEGFSDPAGACLGAFRFTDPGGVFPSVGEGERLVCRASAVFLRERRRQLLRNVDLTRSVVAVDHDLHAVAVLDPAGGVAYLLAQPEIGNAAVHHQAATEGRSVDSPCDGRARLPELRLRVERDRQPAIAELGGEALL